MVLCILKFGVFRTVEPDDEPGGHVSIHFQCSNQHQTQLTHGVGRPRPYETESRVHLQCIIHWL